MNSQTAGGGGGRGSALPRVWGGAFERTKTDALVGIGVADAGIHDSKHSSVFAEINAIIIIRWRWRRPFRLVVWTSPLPQNRRLDLQFPGPVTSRNLTCNSLMEPPPFDIFHIGRAPCAHPEAHSKSVIHGSPNRRTLASDRIRVVLRKR